MGVTDCCVIFTLRGKDFNIRERWQGKEAFAVLAGIAVYIIRIVLGKK